MKTSPISSTRSDGGALLVTIVTVSVIGFVLAGYLSMVNNQNRSTVRSDSWNGVIPVVEAGIEEALTHLNINCVWNSLNADDYKPYADGWTLVNGRYQKRRDVGENYYIVDIDLTDPSRPEIDAQGFVAAPYASMESPGMFAVIGANASTESHKLARAVVVRTAADGIFAKGIVAKGKIDLSGNNIQTDSFDSSDPGSSSNGTYVNGAYTNGVYDPTKNRQNGDVATNLQITNSLTVGNAKIIGKISTGPGGSPSIGPNGSVGSKAWVTSGKKGIEPEYSKDDMNVSFPDVKLPAGPYFNAPPGGVRTNEVVSSVTTNTTSSSFPPPGAGGTLLTNTTATTTAGYPASGTYVGSIVTNFTTTSSTSRPASSPYGPITTNTSSQVTSTPPAPGTYLGLITTNTANTTTTNFPTAGSYVGTVTTNIGPITTTGYPSSPMGSVTTNTTSTTSSSYPAPGTYLGNVTTNSVQKNNQSSRPAEGTYVPGSLVQRSNGKWDYKLITGYTYNQITSYTANGIVGYTYAKITSYFWQKITGYSYPTIASYTYNQIYSYTRQFVYYFTNYVSKTYDHVFTAPGQYQVARLDGSIRVEAPGVILHVTDRINITGQDEIRLLPAANFKLYMSGSTANLGGNGIMNPVGNANSFYYLGLKNNTSVSFSGNASFTGVVYAPYALFTLGGGGNNTYDFVGAAVAQEVKMNGHFNFHYDENLARHGPSRGYLIMSWNER